MEILAENFLVSPKIMFKAFVASVCFRISNCYLGSSEGLTSSSAETTQNVSENTLFKKRMNSILCADLGGNTYQKLLFGGAVDSVDVVLHKTTGGVTLFAVFSKQVTYSKSLDKLTIPGLPNDFLGKKVKNLFKNTLTRDLMDDKSSIQFTEADCAPLAFVHSNEAKKLLQALSSVKLSPACLMSKEIHLVQFKTIGDGKLFAKIHNIDVDVTGDAALLFRDWMRKTVNCDHKHYSLSANGISSLKRLFTSLDKNHDNRLSPQEITGIKGHNLEYQSLNIYKGKGGVILTWYLYMNIKRLINFFEFTMATIDPDSFRG